MKSESKKVLTVAAIAAVAYLATRKGGPLAGLLGLGQDEGHYAGPPPTGYPYSGYYGAYGFNPAYGYPYGAGFGSPYGYQNYGYGYNYYGYPNYSGQPSGPQFSGGPVYSSQGGAQLCVSRGGNYDSFSGQCSAPSGGASYTPYFGTW